MRCLLLCAFVLGCAPAKTSILVHIDSGEPSAPSSVVVSVFDGHGRLGESRIAPVVLPGALTITGLSGHEGVLRIVAVADSPRLLDGVSTQAEANRQETVALMLHASTQDSDGDGVPDTLDDCPTVPDPDQANAAGDGPGDLCRGGDLAPPDLALPSDGGAPADLAQPADLARTPPPTPTGLMATAGDTQVTLNWAASAGASQYTVARASSSAGPYQPLASPSATSYLDTGLTNGAAYYYVVSAVGAGGTSSPSAPVSAKPAPPIANGTYRVINSLSGLALDDDAGGGVGTGLIQWGYSGAMNQQWTFTAVGAYYTITCANNGLNASSNGATATGAQIVLANPAATSDQLWTITRQAGGGYVLTNKLSGLALDDYNNSMSAGTVIDQWQATDGPNQQWSILPP